MKNTKEVRLIVTGASGFIGTNAIDFALARGYSVVNFDIRPPRKAAHAEYWRQVDIRQSKALCDAVKDFRPTHILHLAATTGMDVADLEFFAANTRGVENLLESGLHAPDLAKTVFASSLLVCRNGYIPRDDADYCPPNLYGESKVVGEKLVRERPVKGQWTIVRPTSIWGPWFEYSYMTFFKMVDRGLYLHPGGVPIVKPLSYVENTVHMMTELLFDTGDSHGQTYYLADYPERSIQEWANLIQSTVGARKVPVMPVPVMRAIAACGDLCKAVGWKNPPLTSFRLGNMLTGAHYPIEKTATLVGALPFSMDDGVQRTVAWMRAEGMLRHAGKRRA